MIKFILYFIILAPLIGIIGGVATGVQKIKDENLKRKFLKKHL